MQGLENTFAENDRGNLYSQTQSINDLASREEMQLIVN